MSSRTESFAALAIPLYRILWLAEFAGDLGNWMQTVGAQWVIVRQADALLFAALIVSAARLPILIMAAPAGALADRVDRRLLMLAAQLFQAVVAGVLAGVSIAGHLGASALLAYTFLLGVGSGLSVIAFQALTPQIVPTAQLQSAVAMAQVNLNIARVAGPPIGGLLVAGFGPSSVFVIDACSYLVFVLVLLVSDIPRNHRAPSQTTLLAAILEGFAAIRASPALRRNLLHMVLVTLPCSAVWALLPTLTVHRLRLGASGYGSLLAALGLGSICGVAVLPALGRHFGANRTLLAGNLGSAAVLAVLTLTRSPPIAGICLFGFGAAWLVLQTQLGADTQSLASDETRARTISVFQSVRTGGQGVGALGWGVLGQSGGVELAMLVAAGGFAICAIAVVVLPTSGVPATA